METPKTEQLQTFIDGVQPPPPPELSKFEIAKALDLHIQENDLHHHWPYEQAARDIANQWSPGMDGFELGKNLENNCGWHIVADDVEKLDYIDTAIRLAKSAARKEWAKAWNIQPPYPVGTRVKTSKGAGVVAGLSKYEGATYLIKEDGCKQDGRFLLMKFEDVVPAESDGSPT